MGVHARIDPRRRDDSRRHRRSVAVGGRVLTSMALVAAVMGATSTAGATAPDDTEEALGSAAPVAATLALHVPADASLDGSGLDDASSRGWSGFPGAAAGEGTGPPSGPAGLSGSVLTPATLRTGALPPRVKAAYVAAAERLATDQPACGVPWWLLAGVGQVESGHAAGGRVRDDGVTLTPIRGPRLDGTLAGTAVVRDSDRGSLDGDPAYDRAVGPMQFMPGTWASSGADGDGDGRKDPDDVDDAALAAARYLCNGATGGALAEQGGQAAALFRYNRSVSYGLEVIRWGIGFRDGTAAPAAPSSAPTPAPSPRVSAAPAPPSAAPPSAAPSSAGTSAPAPAPAAVPDPVPDPAPSADGGETAPQPSPPEVPGEVPASADPVPEPSAAPSAQPAPTLPACVVPAGPSTGGTSTDGTSTGGTSTGEPSKPEPTTAPTAAPAPTPSDPSDPSSPVDPSGSPDPATGEPSVDCLPPCATDEDAAPSPTSDPSGSPTDEVGPGDPTDAPPLCAPAPPEEPEPTAPTSSSPTPTGR